MAGVDISRVRVTLSRDTALDGAVGAPSRDD